MTLPKPAPGRSMRSRRHYRIGDRTYGRAQIAAALGDRASAVRLLRQALDEGVPYYFGTPYIGTVHLDDHDPLLQSLSGDSAFEQLLRPKD